MEKKNLCFQYQGFTTSGVKVADIVFAENLQEARLAIQNAGILIFKLRKKRTLGFETIKKRDLILFTRQLATLLKAGISLSHIFEILAKGQSKKSISLLMNRLKDLLEGGLSLTEAFKQQPAIFNELFCDLVHIGEQSASLDLILDKIATYQEGMERFKKKIKKALSYPLFLLTLSTVIGLALLFFVVPQFEAIFKDFGAELPFLTRFVIQTAALFKSFWFVFFFLISLCVLLFQAKKHFERFSLKLPVVGSMLKKAAWARFARTLSITSAAGLPLFKALLSVAKACGHKHYANAITEVRMEISQGQSLSSALKKTNLFPDMLVQMIATGEESGCLDEILIKLADFYEEAVDSEIDLISQLLEPLMMSFLGLLIAGLIIALYLPIFKLGSVI